MRRAGFTAPQRDEIKRAFKLLFRSGLNTRQAIEQAATSDFGPLEREFFEFVADARKRGIVTFGVVGYLLTIWIYGHATGFTQWTNWCPARPPANPLTLTVQAVGADQR